MNSTLTGKKNRRSQRTAHTLSFHLILHLPLLRLPHRHLHLLFRLLLTPRLHCIHFFLGFAPSSWRLWILYRNKLVVVVALLTKQTVHQPQGLLQVRQFVIVPVVRSAGQCTRRHGRVSNQCPYAAHAPRSIRLRRIHNNQWAGGHPYVYHEHLGSGLCVHLSFCGPFQSVLHLCEFFVELLVDLAKSFAHLLEPCKQDCEGPSPSSGSG